ncbi:MAG TPA: hypothetical protein VHS03_14425, partial [Gaiellaceae bacterium]|nr:hypothetical protein [Gaiellaceae bacterium]
MVAMRVLDTFAPDDVAAVRALADEVETETGIEPLGAETWAGLAGNSVLGDLGVLATDDAGRPVGYAHASHHHPGEWSIELAAPARAGGERGHLLAAATDAVAATGGGRVTLWVHGASGATDADDLAKAGGFAPERELLQLRVPLPLAEAPSWPTGVVVRTFRPREDDDAWLGVNNRAFAGHPEQGDWTT